MQRVIVTVKRENDTAERDLEVPAGLEAEQLAGLIARALRLDNGPAGEPLRYKLEAHPLGRALQPNESLADAGVWDGSWLVLHPAGATTLPTPAIPDRHEPQAPDPSAYMGTVVNSAAPAAAIPSFAPVDPVDPVDPLPVVHSAPDQTVAPQENEEREPQTAVSGWRSLGIDLSAAPVQEVQEIKPNKGFSWKQLDE